MIRKTSLYIPLLLLLNILAGFRGLAQPDPVLTLHADGFNAPVDIVHAGDERLFVVERPGTVRILDAAGNRLPGAFLDIRDRVVSGGERGLLGLAFHPAYPDSPYVYVNYTVAPTGDTHISRFSLNPADSNDLDENSEQVLLTVDQPFSNHNAGDLAFGPDGYLYIPLGDGGSANDPQDNGQNRLSFLGKLLRIDVDNGNPYAIPPDNPYVNDDFTLDEIWAVGLRNPWRISFDRDSGHLYIADVGQNIWEEVNFQPAGRPGGQNYGWRCYEANAEFIMTGDCPDMGEVTFPVHAYQHNGANGCSVTGGFVYRGLKIPGLIGKYVYGDFCSGQLWTLFRDQSGQWQNEPLLTVPDGQLSTFGEDSEGELYLSWLGAGQVYKLVDFCEENRPPVPDLIQEGNTLYVEGQYETYTWLLDSIVLPEPGDTLNAAEWGSGTYQVIVENEFGCEAVSAELEVTISSTGDLAREIGLEVRPTIISDYVWIDWERNSVDEIGFRLYNASAGLVRSGTLRNAGQRISLVSVEAGTYFLYFKDKRGREGVFRLVKQ